MIRGFAEPIGLIKAIVFMSGHEAAEAAGAHRTQTGSDSPAQNLHQSWETMPIAAKAEQYIPNYDFGYVAQNWLLMYLVRLPSAESSSCLRKHPRHQDSAASNCMLDASAEFSPERLYITVLGQFRKQRH